MASFRKLCVQFKPTSTYIIFGFIMTKLVLFEKKRSVFY